MQIDTALDPTINVTFSNAALFGCEAKIVAIGGGGKGVRGGGGGSGYVKSKVIDVTSTEYQVSVGQYGQDSFVQKNDGQKLITAQRGEDGHGTRPVGTGGNGYSGGGHGSGGGRSTKGGSDGSDGEGSPYGGRGSGFDISTISLEHHILIRGNGGEPYGSYGGGGGGVLVDNVGPSYGTNQGEGYGGGGAIGQNNRRNPWAASGSGLQGMVLIEAKPKA